MPDGARPAACVVVGAGAMASLAVATAVTAWGRRASPWSTARRERAERLAAEYAARWRRWSALDDELADADLVVSCTGAPGLLVTPPMVAAAAAPGAAGA